jgi:hypothetical protein
MGLEGPVSQLKAVPSSDTGNARFSAASKLAAPPVFAPLDERQLAQWELMTDQLLSAAQARPWHVRHARKLIGGAAVLVAVGFAFYSYYVWPRAMPLSLQGVSWGQYGLNPDASSRATPHSSSQRF